MTANPASTGDLAARWHPYPYDNDDAGDAYAQTKLDEAWRALQGELSALVARMDAGEVETETVIDIIVSAAKRSLMNPEGYARASASIDDYSETWETDPAARSGDLYFTRAELRRLQPSDGRGGAFTIRPGRSPWTCSY